MRIWFPAVIAAVFATACVGSTTKDCNGRVCPNTEVCSPRGDGTCVTQDQIAQCDRGQPACELPGVAAACYDGVCLPAGCGNGIMDPGEVCDDGNTIANDGCSATCDSNEQCGNAHVDTRVPNPEGCDCGAADFTGTRPPGCNGMPNSDAPDAVCTTTCQLRGCGDGIKNGLEDCDGTDIPMACTDVGYYGGTLGCLPTCKFDVSQCTGTCGDHVIDGPPGHETCDGPDLAGTDCTDFGLYFPAGLACTAACTFDVGACTGRCGDGIYDAGHELCDSSETSAQLSMRGVDCKDFGYYQAAGLACDSACQFDVGGCTQRCGDGTVNGPEQCEPGLLGGKTCANFGFYGGTLGCRSDNCTYDTSACAQRCGDGAINGPEQCDGAALAGKTCTTFGYYAAAGLKCNTACGFDTSACTGGRCGDGTRQVAEDCDGNDLDMLDCTDFGFYAAPGLACDGGCGFDTSACTQFCGDRAVQPTHEICEGKLPSLDNSCVGFGFESGDLGCNTSCAYDFSGCISDPPIGTNITGESSARWAAWSAAPNDLWVVGAANFAHWNGSAWALTTEAGTYKAISGTSASNIWAVGANGASGAILHYNGTAWSSQTSGTAVSLNGVYAASATEAFAVGDGGVVLHTTNTGASWVALSLGTPATSAILTSVSGSSSSDVWVVGKGGVLRHWNGASFSSFALVTGPAFGRDLNSVRAWSFVDADAVGASGTTLHWDGTSWTAESSPTPHDLFALAGTSASRYAVGAQNTLVHGTGYLWTQVPNNTITFNLTGVWVADEAHVYLLSNGTAKIETYDGARFLGQQAGDFTTLPGVWGSSNTNVYTGGGTGVHHFDGTSWVVVSGISANAVWGANATQVFAVGGNPTQGTAQQQIGGGWFPMTMAAGAGALNAVWGTSATNLYAVGTRLGGVPTIVRYTGSNPWVTVPSTTATGDLFALWGSSATDIWMGGATDFIHYNGTTGTQVALPASSSIHAIWGSSATNIWAGGDKLFHFDGTAWTQVVFQGHAFTSGLLPVRALTGSGPNDVYLAGDDGNLFHWDGYVWTPMEADNAGNLEGAWTAPGSDVFVSGESGTMLRRARTCAASETACGDGVDDDCDGLIDCEDPSCAGNAACTAGGACSAAIATSPAMCVAGQLVLAGTTSLGSTAETRYACDAIVENGPRSVYKYTTSAAASGTLTATLDGLGRDLDLVVLAGTANGTCDARLGCLGASSTGGNPEVVSIPVTPSTTYYFVVETYASDAGNFTLTIPCL